MADTRAEHIAQLAELIKDVEVAMFTTTGVDGRLYSRPLATQQVAFDGDLWFVITGDSPKVAEIALDPRSTWRMPRPRRTPMCRWRGGHAWSTIARRSRRCGHRR